MSGLSNSSEPVISATALRAVLAGRLGVGIKEIRQRPSAYRTSFLIVELDVECEDGSSIPMMLKNLDWSLLTDDTRRAKPEFLHDPLREIEAYQALLGPAQLGTPVCYGDFIEQSSGRHWLLLERVSGQELYQVGEFDIWRRAARWLAEFHAYFDAEQGKGRQTAHLIEYDGDFYRLWLRRALSWTSAGAAWDKLQWLADRHDAVVDRLLALPTTFMHGEFYASNVLVAETAAGLRVCPVDWEMAAKGPGLMDLAALTAGKWSDDERIALALAYRDAGTERGLAMSATGDFLVELDCCRLHLAVQWLGWSPDWSPPPEHRHDWLAEAMSLAEKLNT